MKSIKVKNFLLFLCFLTVSTSISAEVKTQKLMIPMRDGIRLEATLYTPSVGNGPWPVILERTPYQDSYLLNTISASLLTNLYQYAIVVQHTRGRYKSEGADSVFFQDGWGRKQDGYDTVEWIADQSWCNGKIGMVGVSASGITGYLAAGTNPPHLSCCVILVAASNIYEQALFYGGELRYSLVENWLKQQDAENLIDFFVDHPHYDPIYDCINLSTRWDSVNVPILHIGGWHDIFLQGQTQAFTNIQQLGGPKAAGFQKLIIGPWVHYLIFNSCGELDFPDSSVDLISLFIYWMDRWLKNIKNGIENTRVQYYLMGDPEQQDSPGNRWIEADIWPPEYDPVAFYLHSGGILSKDPPSEQDLPDHFMYDPDNPVPSVGGRNLFLDAGSYDQTAVESREDVLMYTTDILTDSLIISGPVIVKLSASSDAVDTDFTAKLCDVYPDGRSMLVADGIIKARHRNSLTEESFLVPGQVYEFTIDLWSTALAFAPGHAIRLSISSSNYTRFEPNPNTGEPFRQNTSIQIAHQTVYHDAEHTSALILPVIGSSADIEQPVTAVPEAVLTQNYPNPFNSETTFTVNTDRLNCSKNDDIMLTIYDLLGRVIRKWRIYPHTASQQINWNGCDQNQQTVSSGIYICILKAGQYTESKKIILSK
ncbi:MAG: CocE/NonD family hydrolase [bacterium]